MTQNINLLSKKRTHNNSASFALRGLLLLILSFVIWGAYAEFNMQILNDNNLALEKSLLKLKYDLQNKNRSMGLDDAKILMNASSLMQKKLDEHRYLLQIVKNGDIGSMQGYAQFFQSLATIPQEDVWLTDVDISQAGKLVSISGMALSPTSLMRYAEQLNQTFNADSIAFSSLEILKEEASSSTASPPGSAIKFKLY
jgi:Tfp pilus assembly protein PilN